MKMKFTGLLLKVAAAIVLLGGLSQQAEAGFVYVGSWQVDQGPSWFSSPPNGPLAYTAQEAAALLFGGVATDYAISTNGVNVASIDNQGWYSVIGLAGGHKFAEGYSNKYLGQYYGPTSGYPTNDINASASSYVNDNAIGATYTNYAFLITPDAVPEPGTLAMFGLGAVACGIVSYRRRRNVA